MPDLSPLAYLLGGALQGRNQAQQQGLQNQMALMPLLQRQTEFQAGQAEKASALEQLKQYQAEAQRILAMGLPPDQAMQELGKAIGDFDLIGKGLQESAMRTRPQPAATPEAQWGSMGGGVFNRFTGEMKESPFPKAGGEAGGAPAGPRWDQIRDDIRQSLSSIFGMQSMQLKWDEGRAAKFAEAESIANNLILEEVQAGKITTPEQLQAVIANAANQAYQMVMKTGLAPGKTGGSANAFLKKYGIESQP